MELRRTRVSSSIRTEGGLLPADLLAKIAAGDREVPGLAENDFGLAAGDRIREAITRNWNRLVGAWATLAAARITATDGSDPLTTPTRERWLLPLFEELGFGRLATARAVEIEGTAYPVSHTFERVPIHLVGFGVELDLRTKGVRGAAGAAPHALVQEYLNRSDDALWGIVSNGRLLRLLRDSTSLTRQAFVEFDLEAIFEGELYADFALLWSVCHRTRFEAAKPAECLLERWSKKAADDGTRALDKLRGGVERAIETLGAGFLAHPANGTLREALRSGELDRQDYYRELLRLVYRLIFLFTAEDRHDETSGRELLLDPAAPDEAAERYRRFYSTARLRSLAKRRGSRHPDLWIGLRQVIAALGGEGAPTLALPALGSFLFGPTACPHLDSADLRNQDLLETVRALATIEEDRRLRLVDYRNLGAEELGGIYESLLELHPRVEVDATPPRFTLMTAAGNERKTTGSYYTHSALIALVLESALDPAVDQAVRGKDREAAERAILELAVVDPAAGSGHFLVAAAHRLAKRLATIRTGEGEPAPAAVRHALRDVIAHCIYAVDLNPMAVELCKVGLWLEALEPGRPLSFLDAHIKVGNSLVGATPELVAGGIPDAAFDPLDGDHAMTARGLRDRNARERSGQLGLTEGGFEFDIAGLAISWTRLESIDDSSVEDIRQKEREYRSLLQSPEARRQRRAADTWCAAFFALKTPASVPITSASVRQAASPNDTHWSGTAIAAESALAEVGAFHWALEYPDVAERGGFDVVLGNPPWDTLSPDAKEFFAAYDPGVRNVSPRDQKSIIDRLLEDPAIRAAWNAYCWRLYRLANFLRKSGRYRLFAPGNLGKGDFNVYRIFVELALQLAKVGGRVAQLVPDGFYLGANASAIRRELAESWTWSRLFGFENTREVWFKGIDSRTKFCIYSAERRGPTTSIEVAFGLKSEEELRRARDEGGIPLSTALLRQLSPETYAIPDTTDLSALALVERVSSRWPRFGEPHEGWPAREYMRELDMGNDRDRFNDLEGYALYEGRMVDQFDHRAKAYVSGRGRTAVWRDLPFSDPAKAIRPQWFVTNEAVPSKVRPRLGRFRLGFCDVTSPTNERSLVAALLPPGTVAGHKVPTILLDGGAAADHMVWLAVANSFVMDFVARRKVSLQMSYTVLDGLSIPRLATRNEITREVVELAARLTCTSDEMVPFWDDLHADGWAPARSSQGIPGFADDESRARARARLDGLVAVHYFGLSVTEMEVVFADFRALANREQRRFGEFRTRRLVMAEVQREWASGRPGRAEVVDLPPSDQRAPRRQRPLHEQGTGIPRSNLGQSFGMHALDASSPARRRTPSIPPQPSSPVVQPVRRTSQVRPPPDPPLQQTFGAGPAPTAAAVDWRPEMVVEPRDIVLGMRVRHRSHGAGTVLSVEPSGKGAALLIRFDVGGERLIVLGYGVLEFGDLT